MKLERESILSIETMYAQAGTDGERAWLLNQKALEIEGDDPVQMLELALRAREYAARCGDREAWAFSCRHAGIAHHLLAHMVEAQTDLKSAMDVFEELDNKKGMSLVAGDLAGVYQDSGRYDLALSWQMRCLKLCDELGDETGKARTLLNAADIYCALQEDERALNYCEQSLLIARKWSDHATMSTAMANIGIIYARLGRLDRALEYQQDALVLKEESGNTHGIAIGLGNIAALRFARNEIEQALGMYELSLQLRREIGDRRGTALMLQNIGDIHAQSGKHDRALECLLEALELAKALHLVNVQQEIHAGCARLYEAIGNVHAALYHLKESVACIDEGLNRKNLRHVAALELEYDREHDRETHERLRHRVYDLEHLALRSQINPHFLFNALNSIQFFLTANDRESANRYLAKLGRLMRTTLELSREPLVPLMAELESVQLYLQLEQLRFSDRFTHAIEFSESIAADDILVPPMLLQPFVENAVWHGILPAENAGTIRVHVQVTADEELLCVIEDDGIGREESARRRAEKETAGRRHTSVGMRLIADRLSLLRARTGKPMQLNVTDIISIDGAVAGTRVELILPSNLSMHDVR